jgi:hypothetical protein
MLRNNIHLAKKTKLPNVLVIILPQALFWCGGNYENKRVDKHFFYFIHKTLKMFLQRFKESSASNGHHAILLINLFTANRDFTTFFKIFKKTFDL